MKITKDQVKQLHFNAEKGYNQLITNDLENWFPEYFNIKSGNWYTSKVNKGLVFILECNGDEVTYFGFDYEGVWFDKLTENIKGLRLIKATNRFVKYNLIKEATKRGFAEGVNVNGLLGTVTSKGKGLIFPLRYYGDYLEDDIATVIFEQETGTWAQISEPKNIVEIDGKKYKLTEL